VSFQYYMIIEQYIPASQFWLPLVEQILSIALLNIVYCLRLE